MLLKRVPRATDSQIFDLGLFLPFPNRRPPLKVLFTVDVESNVDTPEWRAWGLTEHVKQEIWGETPKGELGLRYQLSVLGRHGLRATFMVESLHTMAEGADRLREIVATIQDAGQDVQLHLHTEWMAPLEPKRRPVSVVRNNLAEYGLAEQETLLGIGLEALKTAGVRDVLAHRAGNFGASDVTLAALSRVGIKYDTSYNVDFLGSMCEFSFDHVLTQPVARHGVVEVPVGWFHDVRQHRRPLQVSACSFAEFRHALWSAWHAGWDELVIVSHSFELVRRGREARPRQVVVGRFGRICEYLDVHRSYFQTVGFADIGVHAQRQPPAIRSNPLRTAGRYMEQIAGYVQ